MSKLFPPISKFHVGMKVLFKSPDGDKRAGYLKYENRIGTIASFAYDTEETYLVRVVFGPDEFVHCFGYRLHPVKERDIKVTMTRIK